MKNKTLVKTLSVIVLMTLSCLLFGQNHWRLGGNTNAPPDNITAPGNNIFGSQTGFLIPINIITNGKNFAQFTVNNGLGVGIPGNPATALGDGLTILNQSTGPNGGLDLWCDANTIQSNGTHIKFDGSGLIQGAISRFEIIGNYDGLWFNARRTPIVGTNPRIIFNIDNSNNSNVHNNNEIARFSNTNGSFRGFMRLGTNPNNFEAENRLQVVDGSNFAQFRITQAQNGIGSSTVYADFQTTAVGDLVIFPVNTTLPVFRRNVGINQFSPTNTLEIQSNVAATVLNPLTSFNPTRSGLRFSSLKSTMGIDATDNTAPSHPQATVLSVNETGDVILVRAGLGTVANADNGTSIVGANTVQLGQNICAGNPGPARLLNNTEIPLNGHYLNFAFAPDAYPEKVGFGIPVCNTGANALRSSNITMQVNGSISLFDGTGNTSLFFGEDQLPNGTLGEWGMHYDVGANGTGGLNFWKPFGSDGTTAGNGFGNRFLFLCNNGNVGVGPIQSGPPVNTLQITSGINSNVFNPATAVSSTRSGLRFFNLNANMQTDAPQNPSGKVLSVNQTGDVILVPDAVGQGIGTCGSPTPLNTNSAVQLNNSNFYFLDGSAGSNSIGIGVPCTPIGAKLSINNVTQITGIDVGTNISSGSAVYGISSKTTGSTSTNTGVLGQALGAAKANTGIYGLAQGASGQNYGGQFVSNGPGASYGIWTSASGGVTNAGIFATCPSISNPSDYSGYFAGPVFATKVSTSAGNALISDGDLKTDTASFNHGLDIIRQLHITSFKYNGAIGTPTDKIQVGVIAEDVRNISQISSYAVDTISVRTNPYDTTSTAMRNILTVNPNALMFSSVNAIKQLDSSVTALQNRPSSQWTTAGNNIYYNTGNVGIGTTNPGAKLEIDNFSSSQSGLIVKGASSQSAGIFQVMDNSSGVLANVTNDAVLQLGSLSSSKKGRMDLLAANGNLSGYIASSLSNNANQLDIAAGTDIFLTSLNSPSLTIYGSPINWHVYGASIPFTFGGYTNFGGEVVMKNLQDNSEVFHAYLADGQKVIFPNGNVGIGTATPTDLLDVINYFKFHRVGGFTSKPSFSIGDLNVNGLEIFNDSTSPSNTYSAIQASSPNNGDLLLNPYGNVVGVGTLNPTSYFHIHENSGYTPQTNGSILEIENSSYQTMLQVMNSGKVGIGTSAPTEALYVVGNIFATGTITQNSDSKLKQNITDISNGMSIINQLKPHSFSFDTTQYSWLNLPKGEQHGLVAQEVETVLPELVTNSFYPDVKDSVGNIIHPRVDYKGVNYTAVIPFLIQGMKEQDSIIRVLQSTINSCCNITSRSNNNNVPSTDVELSSKEAILFQNFPNPFDGSTIIRYFVPENSIGARIIFYDEFGNEIKNMELPNKGITSELNLSTANLASGIYSYSLLVNGKIADTKRMVKAK